MGRSRLGPDRTTPPVSDARPARTLACVGLAALLTAVAVPDARAQLSLYNLSEGRAGYNIFRPDLPRNGTSIYDQLDLEYDMAPFRLGLRYELNEKSQEAARGPGYRAVTQRFAEWGDRRMRVRVGNFGTILGRGLLHRSFELPGVVLEDAYLTRYTPSRDMDGVLAEGEAGPIEARLFSGRPNSGTVSAIVDDDDFDGNDTHQGVASGGQVAARLWRGARAGAGYVRTTTEQEFASGFLDVDPLRLAGVDAVQMPFYVEYARDPAGGDWTRFETGVDGTALYASTNLLWGPVATSAEWKNYRGIRTGINDPPSLVREHSFRLLNRGTHVLNLDREKGFQLEGSYTQDGWATLTLNLSRADGDIGSRTRPRPVRFEERYAEVRIAPDVLPDWEGTIFYQRGKDEFVSIWDRSIVGGALESRFLGAWAAGAEFEYFEGNHAGCFALREDYTERYTSLSLSRAGWGSVAFNWERTSDCLDEDPDDQLDLVVDPNTFVNVVVNAQLSERHTATLFVGERRGGNACTAGTCYVVEPFKGTELRITSRF